MEYYGHTADGPDGQRLLESQWQLVRDHLRNVAQLAKQFAEPSGLASEAELAGLLLGSAGDPPNGIVCAPIL